jgi:hypothetical protein
MSNTKILKIVGVIAVIILLVYSVLVALRSKQEPVIQQNTTNSKLNISTPTGEVQVSNITQNPVEKSTDAVAIAETSDYEIIYYSKDQAFLITLLSQPAQQARDKAEDALLKHLDIGIGDACKLTVSLTVPFDVDPDLAGKDYGLSFCPKGLRF